jgi:hypothetical protein
MRTSWLLNHVCQKSMLNVQLQGSMAQGLGSLLPVKSVVSASVPLLLCEPHISTLSQHVRRGREADATRIPNLEKLMLRRSVPTSLSPHFCMISIMSVPGALQTNKARCVLPGKAA